MSGAAPLSVAQEALWYTSVLTPGATRYNETVSYRKDGPLDRAALERALDEVVRRHEAWRTRLDTVDGAAVQLVEPHRPVALPLRDLSALTPEEAEREAVRVVAEVSRVPYDLRRGPLLRPRLLRFPGEHHRLYLALHHIIFDGVSVYRVVFGELIALYEAFAAGEPSPLPEPAVQYADYARDEQEWIAGPRAVRRLDWWASALAELPPPPLPHDHRRPEAPSFRGGILPLTVPAEVVERLRAIGQDAGASLFAVLAATWSVLLARYAGCADVVFATPADLRRRPEHQGVVGYCLTPMVVRADLAGDPTFVELVVRVRNAVLDGLDHLVPFERLVRRLSPDTAAHANPVYQTLIVLEPAEASPHPDWSIHLMESEIGDIVGTAKVDLELALDERADGRIEGRLVYERDVFDRATAERVLGLWLRIVAAAAAEPAVAVSRMELTDPAEARQEEVEFNATNVSDPDPALVERVRAASVHDRTGPGIDAIGLARAANVAQVLGDELGIVPSTTVLALAGADPVIDVWPGLAAGARVVLAPADAARDGRRLSRLIAAEHADLLIGAPDDWAALLATGLRGARALRLLSRGGPLSPETADALLDRCRVLWNGYASAATGGLATLGRVEAGDRVTIGRPIANVRASVLDAYGRPVPRGVVGELVVAPAFGSGPVRTGDPARRLPDGRIECLRS